MNTSTSVVNVKPNARTSMSFGGNIYVVTMTTFNYNPFKSREVSV
jgi:hypothetical protein